MTGVFTFNNHDVQVSKVSWYITSDPKDGSAVGCFGSGGTYNPFNITAQVSRARPPHALIYFFVSPAEFRNCVKVYFIHFRTLAVLFLIWSVRLEI